MAKDSSSSSKIWRTVVFAGAMLGTPTLAAAESAPPPAPKDAKAPAKDAKAPTAGAPAMPVAAKPDPAFAKQEQIKTLDAERTALLSKLAETDPKDIETINRQILAKDAAIKKLVTEIVNLRRPRPRTPVVQKPVGRGFVLA